MSMTPRAVLAIVTSMIVAGAVITGIVILPPPADVRMHRLDERRVADLRMLYAAMNLYYKRYNALPSDLAALEREPDIAVSVTDPATRQYYEYRALEGGKYEVCARFDEATANDGTAPANSFWRHGAGRYCYQMKAIVVR